MSKVRSQLRYGLWPDSPTPAHHDVGLTVAARRLAEATVNELRRLGVEITLDDEGKARFRTPRMLSAAARLSLESHADLIETYLRESNQSPSTREDKS